MKPRPLALTLSLALLTPALAHEMAHAGDVGGLLHIEPDDAPVVGQPNVSWFELTRRGGASIAATCTCSLKVYAGSLRPGQQAVNTPALEVSQDKLTATITFPKAGAYTLVLSGKPKAGNTFAPFTLQWVVRADAGGQ